MYKYAQIILETGRCIGLSLLAEEVEAGHMIPLEDDDDVQPGDIYMDGGWTRPEPEPTPEPGPTAVERIAALQSEMEAKDRENKLALFEIYNMLLGGE